MKFIAVFIGLISLPLWAADQSTQTEYNRCILEGYYEQNDGSNSCDFSNVQANMNSVTRNCNMAMVKTIDLDNLTAFTSMLDELQSAAFGALNKDLNSKLYGCGYMGEIELTANGGRSEVYKFTVNAESCSKLAALVTSNNNEYTSASPERQDELREQNHLLNRVAERSNCSSSISNEVSDQSSVQ